MPRFVPIIIQVKGGDDAKRVAEMITNAFKQINKGADESAKSTEKASQKTKNAFNQIGHEAESSAKSANSSFSKYLSAEFFGALAQRAFQAFLGFSKQFVTDSVRLAQELQNALLAISSIAAFRGIDPQAAQEAVRGLRLVHAGIITVGDAATGLKNLLQAGFGLEQSITLLERFSDTAAFGKQAALSYGEAIRSATEGIKNQNSILVDNAGITKNIEVILRERGHTIQDLSDKVKGLSAREALYSGLLAESQAQLGDADKLTRTYTGAIAAEDTAYQNVQRTIGGVIISNAEWIESTKLVAEQLNNQADALKNSDSETAKFANNILSYAASIKAQLIPFAAFMVHLFLGIGHTFNAGVATFYEAITRLTESVVNTVIAGSNKMLEVVNWAHRKLGLPEFPKTQPVDFSSNWSQQRQAEWGAATRDFDAAARLSAEGKDIRNRLADARWMAEFNRSLGLEKEKRDALTRKMEETSNAAQDLTGNMKAAGSAAKDAFKLSGQLPVPTSGVAGIDNKIREVAARYGIDERLAFAQIFQESKFNPNAVSPKGARGLGQFMPGTGAQYGLQGRSDFTSVNKNLEAYGAHMRDLLARYGGNVDLALIAYNWGTGNADKVIAGLQAGRKVRLPAETRGYVSEIGKFGPFGKDVEPLTQFTGKTPLEIAAIMRAKAAREPLETSDLAAQDLPREITKPWDLYYDHLQTREQELADRRKFFADELIADQRNQAVDLGNVELDLSKFRAQQADDQFVEQRRLLSAKSEELDLLRNISQVEDDLANSSYNESLRIQLALLEDIANLRRRDEEAIKAENRAQLELSDATIVHGQQVRANVLEHLASQRTMTEAWSDGIIAAYDKITSFIDRGIEKLTHGIPIITQLVSALVHQLANRIFQRFLDMVFPPAGGGQGPNVGGRQSSGGFFGAIGNFLSGAFNRGVASTPTFVGFSGFGGLPGSSPGLAGAGLAGLFGSLGGGISAPQSLSSQVASQAAISTAIHESGHTAGSAATTAAGGFSLSGLGSSFAAIAPLLGVGLGSSLGGQSRFGSILGGVGGGLLGLGVAASLGSTTAASLLGPLAALGVGVLPIAIPLIIGAILLGRNAQRRRDETTRNTISNDTGTAIWQLIGQARSLGLSQATAQWNQIKNNYFSQIAQIKDSKTRRHAEMQWTNDFAPLWKLVEKRAQEGDAARIIDSKLIPEFAYGGTVPRSTLFSMASGLTPIKVRPGEVMIPPGGFASVVPGVDRGYDSMLTMARPGTRVLTRSQAGNARGFAGGGTVGGDGDVVFDVTNDATAELLKVLLKGLKSRDGRKLIVNTVNSARADNEL